MKKNFGIILAIALGLSALLLTIAFQAGWVEAGNLRQETREGAPTIVSYQGQVWDDGLPFVGSTGYFKVAITDATGTTQYWSNDTLTTPPTAYVALLVSNGFFSVNLGDTSIPGMNQPLTASVFNNPDTRLRMWFSPDAISWTQMPDQKIAAVPYALQAQNADMLDGKVGSEYQLRVSTSCVEGSAIKTINSDGSVFCESIPDVPVSTLSNLVMESEDHAMVIGSDGLGFIAFYDPHNADLRSIHCSDINCSSGTSYDLDTVGDVGQDVDVAIGTDGFPLISYYDATTTNLKVVHCDDVTCSSRSRTIYDSGNDVGKATSIVIGSSGSGLISFVDQTGNDVMVGHCIDVACSAINANTIADEEFLITDTEITIREGSNGLVAYNVTDQISWTHLKVRNCIDWACTSGSLVFTGPEVVLGSMTTGVNGFGLLSLSTGTDLIIMYCMNFNCTSYDWSTLGTSALGKGSSIIIGADNLPLISFINPTNNLTIAHCNDPFCNTFFIYTLDDSGTADTNTSIAVGIDGMGLVIYYDGTNDHLRSVHCSNRFCNPDY